MTKTTKLLLAISLTGLVSGLVFVTGLINVSDLPVLYVTLPTGAIFLGLFMLSKFLEKETALYDDEQRKILDTLKSAAPQAAPVPNMADALAKWHSA